MLAEPLGILTGTIRLAHDSALSAYPLRLCEQPALSATQALLGRRGRGTTRTT